MAQVSGVTLDVNETGLIECISGSLVMEEEVEVEREATSSPCW